MNVEKSYRGLGTMSDEVIELKESEVVQLENQTEGQVQEVQVPQNNMKEVKDGLATFIGKSFERAEDNYDLERRINEAIYERLPEADFDQLLALKNSVANTNNSAMKDAMRPFVSANSDKNIVEHNFKNDDTANLASALYNGTSDKKELQSLAYLWQVISMAPKPQVVDITPEEEKKQ